MATFNRGGSGGGGIGARDLVSPTRVWALYPHSKGTKATKIGASEAVVAEVYELLTDEGTATRYGSGVFFQTTFRGLPLGAWSVGVVSGPSETQNYYGFDFPVELEAAVERCMDGLPDHPDVPEELPLEGQEPPIDDGFDDPFDEGTVIDDEAPF